MKSVEGSVVAIISDSSNLQKEVPEEQRPLEHTICNRVKVARSVTIPPSIQVPVVVETEVLGLSLIQAHSRNLIRSMRLLANFILDLQPETNFSVRMPSLRDFPTRVRKYTVVGIALPAHRILFTDVAPEGTPKLQPETSKEDDKPQLEVHVRRGDRYRERTRGY